MIEEVNVLCVQSDKMLRDDEALPCLTRQNFIVE
jgi:hypothetical protein